MGSKQSVRATVPDVDPARNALCPAIEAKPVARGSKGEQKDHSLPAYQIEGPVKCLLIGDKKVGKTSLLQAFSKRHLVTPETKYVATIGVDIAIVYAALEANSAKAPRYYMQFWDLAGQERFRALTQAYCKKLADRASAIGFLCFDLTDGETLENLKTRWLPITPASTATASYEGSLFYLVGCKADRPDAQLGLGKAFAEELKMPYFETSAVTGGNVAETFLTALRDKFKPDKRLPWEGPSLEDYLQAFDDKDVQAFFQAAGLTKPRTGLQLLIAEYAMTPRGYTSRSVPDKDGDERQAGSGCVPRNTAPWYGINKDTPEAVD